MGAVSVVDAPGTRADAPDLHPQERPLLEVEGLSVNFTSRHGLPFRRRETVVRAVDDVSFAIPEGRTLGLVGESGCGKSTTGRAIVRLNTPEPTSSMRFAGVDLAKLDDAAMREHRAQLQMIFQDPYSSLDPRMTIGSIIREPLDVHGRGTRRDRIGRVRELLDVVGLPQKAIDRYPHQFSGGQRQRVGIARALALQPRLIIADEPVSALDVSMQAQIVNLMKRLQQQFDLTYLFIAHDLAVVRHMSDRVMVMYLGGLVESGTADEVYSNPSHPYTVALLSAAPVPDPKIEARRRRIILKGDVPSPANPPAGCRFHSRCWMWQRLGRPEICTTERPAMGTISGEHAAACHFRDEVNRSPEQRSVVVGGRV